MKKLTFKSIQNRLTFWFLFIALIPLLLTLIITYIQRVNFIETRTFEKLIAIRDLKVKRLQGWLSGRVGDMDVLSRGTELDILENIINQDNKNYNAKNALDKIRTFLNLYMNHYPAYNEIFIINPKTGIILVSTGKSSEGSDKSKDKYYTNPLKTRELFIKDIYYSKSISDHSMAYSIPVFCKKHGGKHITGILVQRIDLHNSLYAILLDRVGLGKTGETLIVNRDAVALNELRWHDNAPLNLQIKAEPAVNAAHGETGITITTDYRGEKILAAYTYIPETGWGFVSKQDLSELYAPVRGMIKNFIILFIISTLLIYFAAIVIGKNISKPIIEMDGLTKKIKAGNFSVRIAVNSHDELGSLSESINEMTASIENRISVQNGVKDISETIIGRQSTQEFGSGLLEQLMEITGANMSAFYILNEQTSEFEHLTSIGANKKLLKSFNSKNPRGEFDIALSKKSIYYLRDIPEDTIFKFQTIAGDAIPKEIITIPVLVESIVLALISLVIIRRFNSECYNILEQSWLSINSAYSNLIANEKTSILAENLSKTNQYLEAQSEELQSQSEELEAQSEELMHTSEELQNRNFLLQTQQKKVENANKLKSEFLSNMSHELRTPLNSIMALSRVLIIQVKDKLTEEENNYLKIVERNGKQLLSLINDILDLSKIESGKMDIRLELILLDSELSIIKENLQLSAEKKGISINLNTAGRPLEVETDKIRLRQILSNIIQNAVKFTEKGRVDIFITRDTENAYIKVKDTGIGIDEDDLLHIFDEFRQIDGSSSRKYEGTGLGLAIAAKLIKILGGRIDVESKPGEGSTFTITLPVKWKGEVNFVDLNGLQPDIHHASKKTILPAHGNTGLPNILVIEDNTDNMTSVKAILKNRYNVLEANNGEHGLELSMTQNPVLILLDMSLPGIDGIEVVKIMKKTKETQKIPVIALTARAMNEDRKIFLKAGCDDFIAKPVDSKILLNKLNKWLR